MPAVKLYLPHCSRVTVYASLCSLLKTDKYIIEITLRYRQSLLYGCVHLPLCLDITLFLSVSCSFS